MVSDIQIPGLAASVGKHFILALRKKQSAFNRKQSAFSTQHSAENLETRRKGVGGGNAESKTALEPLRFLRSSVFKVFSSCCEIVSLAEW
jgi:hypothetical protein